MRSRVAIVARDPELRLAAAKAFDTAPAEWKVCLFDQAPPDADAVVFCDDVDADGIRFDPTDPAGVVADVERALARSSSGRSVFVVGACGGAGTTSVSLHLAKALARTGSVCYLESDPNRGARHRLGLPEEAPAWDAVGKDTEGLLRAAIPVEGSFRALLMPSGDPGDGHKVRARCEEFFDRVVIDVGAGVSSGALTDALAILVLTPSLVSARRARELLEERPDVTWAIVSNRVGPGSETNKRMLERVLEHRITLELPCTPALRDREDECRLLGSWSRWSSRLDRLAQVVAKT
jgi:CO dehydrogenase nickel-insertion accessory protein CooC1